MPKRWAKPHSFLLAAFIGVFTISCLEEPEFSRDSDLVLSYSADTISFDTLFTTVGSASQRFRIYNLNTLPLQVEELFLAGDEDSPFRIYLNGERGTTFRDVGIAGNDSLLLIAEVTIHPEDQDLPFLVKDSIGVVYNGNVDYIKLVAWGRQAVFLKDTVLSGNITWTSARPYVLQGNVIVDSLALLTIEAGTEVYGDNGALLGIRGRVLASGDTADARILFSSVRQDESYRNYPGQWFGILVLEGSENNRFSYTDIRNARFGFRLQTRDDNSEPDLSLESVSIANMSEYGILAFNADIEVTNSVITYCALGGLAGFSGGNYSLTHNTLLYYSSLQGLSLFREEDQTLLQFSDNILINDEPVAAPLSVELTNNIVWGFSTLEEEITIVAAGLAPVELSFDHNILKTNLELPEENQNLRSAPFVTDPQDYNFALDSLSPGIDAGSLTDITLDFNKRPRDEHPDIGAFERHRE